MPSDLKDAKGRFSATACGATAGVGPCSRRKNRSATLRPTTEPTATDVASQGHLGRRLLAAYETGNRGFAPAQTRTLTGSRGSERMAQRPLPSWLSALTSSDPLTRVPPRLPAWPLDRPGSPTSRPDRPGRQTLRIAGVRGSYVPQLGTEFESGGRKGTPIFRTLDFSLTMTRSELFFNHTQAVKNHEELDSLAYDVVASAGGGSARSSCLPHP
jgi:hypothetical protein